MTEILRRMSPTFQTGSWVVWEKEKEGVRRRVRPPRLWRDPFVRSKSMSLSGLTPLHQNRQTRSGRCRFRRFTRKQERGGEKDDDEGLGGESFLRIQN